MRARGLILFILLNVMISLGVAYLVIQFMDSGGSANQDPEALPFRTIIVQITTTPQPPQIVVVTATPREGEVASIPTGVLDAVSPTPTETAEVQSNVSEAQLAANPELQSTISALPQGCIVHTLEEGESPALLAETYSVTMEDILAVNELTEDDARFLQIGQVLTIPLEGCSLIPPETEDEEETETGATATLSGTDETPEPEITDTPTITPTITLAPTASVGNAQVEIVEVTGVGDVTAEAIVIFNSGRNVNLNGWTLTDLDGNEFEFSDQNLFTEGSITIFSRFGTDTTVSKFWNLTEPLMNPGDVLTLLDGDGNVRSIVRIPER